MGMHLKNSWQEKLCISVCVVAIINQLIASLNWGHDSWQMTEWLINYAGGFVRRGLPGEAILLTADHTRIQANYLVIFISFTIYFLVFAIIRSKSKSLFSSAFLLSPVALGSAAYQDFIVRKDALGILLLLACLYCYREIKRPVIRLVMCNILASLGILSHETFFFYALPALIIINADVRSGEILARCKKIAISCASFMPSILTFILVTHYHGTWITAKKVNLSLLPLWDVIEPVDTCNCHADARGSIDALAWTASEGLSLSKGILNSYSHGIWVPLAWVITIILCYYATIYCLNAHPFREGYTNKNCNKQNLNSILLFQLLMIAPLFAFGWDFGRWIFLWINSSICIFIFDYKFSDLAVKNRFTRKMGRISISQIGNMRYILLILIGIPICCWTIESFYESTPIGYFLKLIYRY